MNIIEKKIIKNFIKIKVDPKEKRYTYIQGGQYVFIHLKNDEKIITAIASKKNNHYWDFFLKASEENIKKMAPYKEGGFIAISEAIGRGYEIKKASKKYLFFISGGIGITSFYDLLLGCFQKKQKVSLLYSCQSEEDILYFEDLQEWEKNLIDVKITLTNPSLKWEGSKGRVQNYLKDYFHYIPNLSLLLCGSSQFEEDIKNIFYSQGLEKKDIYTNF